MVFNSQFYGFCVAGAVIIAALALPTQPGSAQEAGSQLPDAPAWKDGAVLRGSDGRLTLDSSAVDTLAALTEGRRRVGMGSGFFVTRRGSVVTNHHVIARCGLITVETPWSAVATAELVASDAARDLALLHTEINAPGAVSFSHRRKGNPGERLMIIGYPTLTLPPLAPQIDSAVHGRAVPGRALVMLKATVAPGSSGGPTLDRMGRLAGVITGEVNTPAVYKKTGRMVREVAVAVPASEAASFLSEHGIVVSRSAATTPLDDAALTEIGMQVVTRIGCWS